MIKPVLFDPGFTSMGSIADHGDYKEVHRETISLNDTPISPGTLYRTRCT